MTKRIYSPYRICPLGAHVDHQGGPVLGRTIDMGTTLDYEPVDSNEIRLTSDQFSDATFPIGMLDTSHWARYAQAAARVLNAKCGMNASVSGSLVGSGLSSSASIGLAYLKALAEVNGVDISKQDLVQWDYELEHGQLGLQNGILDPLTIVYGKKDSLLLMDTRTATATPIPDPSPRHFAWIVAYSGVSRELTKSGFNVRVEECRQAAARLWDGAKVLSDVPPAIFEERKRKLPENLRKRAEHYFTEVERVRLGAQAWKEADLDRFGLLMNRSCSSSINHYESGSAILIELHDLVSNSDGVYGSRFSGGGYGGCVIALAQGNLAEEACIKIEEQFTMAHPELPARVFTVQMRDGLL